MKPTNRYIIMNSSLLFITAQIIEMTLHEFGHFIAAMVVHAQQIVIHHNYTTNISDGLLPEKFIWIKAAGPFVRGGDGASETARARLYSPGIAHRGGDNRHPGRAACPCLRAVRQESRVCLLSL